MARRDVTVRVRRLHDEQDEMEPYAGMTPAERLAMVWTLTQECWALSGQPMPSYPRERMPVVVRRRRANDGE